MIVMLKRNNFEELKVVELKELCRKAGIKGYSKMKKAELVDALKNSKELKKSLKNEARDFAKTELGRDFDKAVMFWKRINSLKYITTEAYYDMVEGWKLLTGLLGLVDDEKKYINITDSFKNTAQAISSIFCSVPVDFDGYTDEELRDYILDNLNNFSLSVFSKKLTKDTGEIIKMSMDDFNFEDLNTITFDSTKASKFTGKEVKAHKGDMRIVETAEDAILRMLKERENPISSVTVFMGKASQDKEEQILIDQAKRRIFSEGFTDVFSGKHYMFCFQNPSSCRKANFMFVEANTWDEVFQLWLEITGLKTWEDFEKAFYDKEGKVNMAKLLARVSTRGSNSFSVAKVAPDLAEVIKNFNVHYCGDTETKVYKDYKTLKGPGLMDMVTGEYREIVDGDGQGIVSYTSAAIIAASMRRISRDELAYFTNEFARIGSDVHDVKPGSRLEKIIKKVPAVFQIRHGEKKGLLVRWNLEAIKETKDIDVIIPDSVRKFIGGEWADYPLEICNFLKGKGEWAYLNPQFISALDWENPNALIPIAKYWAEYETESITDIAKAQQFHGIIKSSDDENNKTISSNLVAAMRTSSDLIDDLQILNWRKDQYRKFNSYMTIGRMMVKGQYTYMVFDPAYQINKWFSLDLPCLASGEFYHNGKECQAAMFRSPLIAPYEAKKVTLVNNEEYKYLTDTVIFNGFDGAADDMGGGDHDGDTCEIVCDDNFFGKIIVDGVRNVPYVVWEPGQAAKKVPFTVENLIEHLVTSAVVSRVGIITNYATCGMDIVNHLKASVHFAKLLGCENITLFHPRAFGKGLGYNYKPQTMMIDGKKTFAMKGYVECQLTKQGKSKHYENFNIANVEPSDVDFASEGLVGTFSFDEIMEKAEYYMGLVEILRILQGREIDGAKTGVYAEGVSGEDFIEAVKIKFAPRHLITRQRTLDRDVSMAANLNQYISLSPLGRLHDYCTDATANIVDMLDNGSNKIFLLQSLLTEEEANVVSTSYRMTDGSVKSLTQILEDRKKAYNMKIYTTMKNLHDEEDVTTALSSIKSAEIDELYNLANILNTTPEVIAVASYIATYTKDSKQSEGLTYAWLLFDELLSVFSRGNKKFELFRLPANVENACIVDKVLYVNGNKYIDINANDCDNVVIQTINGRPYALIHKISDNAGTQRKSNVVFGSKTYTIGTLGFKYHIAGDNPKEEWKKLVRENGFVFDITMDATNRAVLSVNGKSISALMSVGADFDLMNKKVKVVNNAQVNPIKETNASITNIQVVIIGEV